MIKRLIFDIDGTLIQGVNFINSISETLRKLDIYSEENVKLFLNGIQTYEQLYNNYNVTNYTHHIGNAINKKLPQNFVSIFFDELKMCIPPTNNLLIDTIHSLSQKYELVLLTNYFAQSQLNRLNNMGIGKYFSECFGENIIKPNKQAYLTACGNKKPNECVMIGDDIYLDIIRAKQEGLNTIFVNSKKIEVTPEIGLVVNSIEEITTKIITNLENEFSNQ